MDLLIATANPGKIREFREMLDAGHAGGITWSDLSSVADAPNVEETGKTFRANACLKASSYAKHFNRWALADDSGLEVDALDGSPGVYSARWASMHEGAGKGLRQAQSGGDEANNRLLLKQIESVPDDRRTARFVCVLALSDPQGRIVLTARDTVEGRIIHQPRGTNGFGYDPLFLIDQLAKTTAELSADEKHAISHRGKALRGMRELMERARLIG